MSSFNFDSGFIMSSVWREQYPSIVQSFCEQYEHISSSNKGIILFSIPEDICLPVLMGFLKHAHAWDSTDIFSLLQNLYGKNKTFPPEQQNQLIDDMAVFMNTIYQADPLKSVLVFRWLAQFFSHDTLTAIVDTGHLHQWAWQLDAAQAALLHVWGHGNLPEALWNHIQPQQWAKIDHRHVEWITQHPSRIPLAYRDHTFCLFLQHSRNTYQLYVAPYLEELPVLSPMLSFLLYLSPDNHTLGYNKWLAEHDPHIMLWIEERERSNQLTGACYLTLDDWLSAYHMDKTPHKTMECDIYT